MAICSIFVGKVKRITNLNCEKIYSSCSFCSFFDLKKEENLISSDDIYLGVGTTRAINKCTTTHALEVRKFKQNAQKFLIHLVEKLKEQSL